MSRARNKEMIPQRLHLISLAKHEINSFAPGYCLTGSNPPPQTLGDSNAKPQNNNPTTLTDKIAAKPAHQTSSYPPPPFSIRHLSGARLPRWGPFLAKKKSAIHRFAGLRHRLLFLPLQYSWLEGGNLPLRLVASRSIGSPLLSGVGRLLV